MAQRQDGRVGSGGQQARTTVPAPAPDSRLNQPPESSIRSYDEAWKSIDRLIDEQKFQAALEETEEILSGAREENRTDDWTRALILRAQLQMALHGYETAVETILAAPWPEEADSRLILDLYTAQSLVTYLRAYGWEIRQRERVIDDEELDLKLWTESQIYRAAQRRYLDAWEDRESWGAAPLGELAEQIEQNDYPPRIRGTLRDAVTYLFADLLRDSSFWSPEHSSRVYRLSAGELLEPGAPSPPADLRDPEVHPLEKMAAVLGDLEDWHGRGDRPEASFEAYRTRLVHLRSHLDDPRDQERLRAALDDRIDELGRRLPWWSMGTVTLAEMVRDSSKAPDRMIEARRLALEAHRAHPASVGGKRGQHVAAAIEAPSYDLEAMASDGFGKRSLRIRHKNLNRLHLRAYRLDLVDQIRSSEDYNLLPRHREVEEILNRRRPVASWSVDLPETSDYRMHQSYSTPPMKEPGLYLVAASAREDFRDTGNRRVATNLFLTDLILLSRQDGPEIEVTARSGETGKPLSDTELRLFRYDWQDGHREVGRATTGAGGRVTLILPSGGGPHFLVAEHDGHPALQARHHYRQARRSDGTTTSALVYTDRAVYRPGQTLHWKIVAYRGGGEESRYETLPDHSVTVELRDANGEEVASRTVTTNDFGTASGELEIPTGRLLGEWSLRTTMGGSASLRVEEYKRPTFEVTIEEPEETLRLNRTAELRGEARYYFGLPVVTGEVSWQVTREPVRPPWWFWWGRPPEPPRIVASGETSLDDDGEFRISFVPEADERKAEEGVTYRFRLHADVTDEGGETRSSDRTFRLGFVAVEARIEAGQGFFDAAEEPRFTVIRTDLDGSPRKGTGAWEIRRLEQPSEAPLPAELPVQDPGEEPFATPGDRLRPRWQKSYETRALLRLWEDGDRVARGTLEHGEDGTVELSVGSLEPGAYRLRYRTEDRFGTEYETHTPFVVARAGTTPLAVPAHLAPEADSLEVGDTARILVHSGLADQPIEVELFHRGERIRRRDLSSESGTRILEIPVGPELRGGFEVAATVLRDHQLIRLTEEVFVPWSDRKLAVSFSTFRDQLRPGQEETWTVTVSGQEGNALPARAAEVLALMYDRSLDIFAPFSPPEVLALYPRGTGVPGLVSTLGQTGTVWSRTNHWYSLPGYPSLRGDRLQLLSGYGIGGPGRRGLPGRPMPMAGEAMRMERGLAEAAPAEAREEVTEVTAESPALADREAETGPEEAPAEERTLRTDFSETAFFEPHLLTDEDGTVSFRFRVPDSVTDWNVWALAVTRDLRGGSAHRTTKTVKELMVRPYLPRFLREGDRATVRAVVNNAGEETLSGSLRFAVEDPETGRDRSPDLGLTPEQTTRDFTVEPGKGTTLEFPLEVPSGVGTVAFRVTATAGDLSDGELRPIPILPGRVHLIQSRFAALSDAERRVLRFQRLLDAASDPSLLNEQLVVTLDAQLFYQVLEALPYLVEYPYECTEQTLNRFVSTGIVTSVFEEYPAVAEMAKELGARETRYEKWDPDDPNRKMQLVETPWLDLARGGGTEDLIPVLDPEVSRAHRAGALADLEKSQTSLGAFPWFPGGPPSPYMTLYILHGFSKAIEHGVEVPRPMVRKAWSYLHRHWVDELARRAVREDCCWEFVTFLNYVLSSYPDEEWTGGVFTADDRRQMLELSWRHWKQHSPLLKAQLALTLHRSDRPEDATLVFDSLMDSARTDPDLGTYWAPEDRAWLWYNDTIESHAFALRAMMELDPDDPRREGLVQWLFLNKQLNHWKSTRATAEVIWAVVHFLEAEGQLGTAEAVDVSLGPIRESFVFEPDEYTGKENRVVVPGPEVTPPMGEIVVEKETPGFLFASATWHFSTERLPEEPDGDMFRVERSYFLREPAGGEWILTPIEPGTRIESGDQIEVQLSISARHAAEYVHLRDPRGAGFEPESLVSRYRWERGLGYYEEVRDSGTNFFFDRLPAGQYTLRYRLRATLPGTFRVGPATLQGMYAPEFAGHSAGNQLRVTGTGN